MSQSGAQTAVLDENPGAADHYGKDDDDLESSLSSSDDDADMDRLLRENSVDPSSSSSEDEDDASRPKPEPHQGPRNKHFQRRYDSPSGNLSVLMLACWTLRLPVTYMDFNR
jgi:RNA polymerase I-specific transcription initiation factor RRN7